MSGDVNIKETTKSKRKTRGSTMLPHLPKRSGEVKTPFITIYVVIVVKRPFILPWRSRMPDYANQY